MSEYYSLEEVARRLGRSEDQVREMVSNGELRAFRDAGSLKFRQADIDTLAPGAPPEEEETVAVAAEREVEDEPVRDELLFLIDEEEGTADPDDLTLIGEGEEGAALVAEESEEMFTEEIGLTAGEEVDDEALTAVMARPEADIGLAGAEAPTVDIVAEAREDMDLGAEPTEVEAAALPFAAAERMRRRHAAAEARDPVMSVLLVVAFLALLWTGVVIYNMFVLDPKPLVRLLGG